MQQKSCTTKAAFKGPFFAGSAGFVLWLNLKHEACPEWKLSKVRCHSLTSENSWCFVIHWQWEDDWTSCITGSYDVIRCHTMSYDVIRCHTMSYGLFGVWSSRIGNCRWNSPFEKWTEETFAMKKSASTLPYLTSQGPPNQEGSHFRLQISQIEFSKSKTQSGEPQKLLF